MKQYTCILLRDLYTNLYGISTNAGRSRSYDYVLVDTVECQKTQSTKLPIICQR